MYIASNYNVAVTQVAETSTSTTDNDTTSSDDQLQFETRWQHALAAKAESSKRRAQNISSMRDVERQAIAESDVPSLQRKASRGRSLIPSKISSSRQSLLMEKATLEQAVPKREVGTSRYAESTSSFVDPDKNENGGGALLLFDEAFYESWGDIKTLPQNNNDLFAKSKEASQDRQEPENTQNQQLSSVEENWCDTDEGENITRSIVEREASKKDADYTQYGKSEALQANHQLPDIEKNRLGLDEERATTWVVANGEVSQSDADHSLHAESSALQVDREIGQPQDSSLHQQEYEREFELGYQQNSEAAFGSVIQHHHSSFALMESDSQVERAVLEKRALSGPVTETVNSSEDVASSVEFRAAFDEFNDLSAEKEDAIQWSGGRPNLLQTPNAGKTPKDEEMSSSDMEKTTTRHSEIDNQKDQDFTPIPIDPASNYGQFLVPQQPPRLSQPLHLPEITIQENSTKTITLGSRTPQQLGNLGSTARNAFAAEDVRKNSRESVIDGKYSDLAQEVEASIVGASLQQERNQVADRIESHIRSATVPLKVLNVS